MTTQRIGTLLTGSLLALSIGSAFAAGSPGVEHTTQAFLEALEAGNGKPLETLAPKDARAVLVGAQAGVRSTSPAPASRRRASRSTASPWS